MTLPHGAQWEWLIGDLALLAFLFWELFKVRRWQRENREKARREAADPPTDAEATPSRACPARNKPEC